MVPFPITGGLPKFVYCYKKSLLPRGSHIPGEIPFLLRYSAPAYAAKSPS